jgi:hypothetical protein
MMVRIHKAGYHQLYGEGFRPNLAIIDARSSISRSSITHFKAQWHQTHKDAGVRA